MSRKITKEEAMKYYYSNEELKDMMHMSTKSTLRWLERARRFFGKITPRATKKLQDKLILEGW
jgi:hypothetical protein